MIDSALAYHAAGLAVIPCASQSKTPALNWKTYQHNRPTESDLRGWFRANETHNLAVICGAVSSNLAVLDFDDLTAFERWAVQYPDLARSAPIVATSRGRHVYLKTNAPIRNYKAEGCDLRANGGYVIAPPSIHPSGLRYELLSGDFASIPTVDPDQLPPRAERNRGRVIREGQRNTTLTSLAGRLRREGKGEAEILEALRAENTAHCRPPLPDSEVATIAASVARYPVPDQEQYSDRWNAQKLIAKCGNDLRYVPAWRVWLVWDGKRWKRDDTQQAERWADDVIRSLYAEAAQITDSAKRQELAEWARRSESAHAQEAMLRTAEKFVAIAPGQLDSDPMLFNVLNGTLNLQTGKLRPHRREDLLTKIAGAKYLAGATQPVWTRFLREATGGNRQLAAFLARAVGYSLTGDTGEEKLFFVHGPTATGKSTFLEAVKSAMGEYAASADFETFLSKPTGGGIRNDIARLAGARFVASLEMEDGRKLAEGLVKQLTGGDTIAARFLYAESFEFRPQFKLWLAANSEPKADDSDGALWRRILRVPFDREIPKDKRDPEIKKTLRDDPEARAAILAWAVKGLRAWRKTGLGVPPVVEKATEAYRRRQNPLSEFVEARCEATAGAWISSANLRLAYEIWAQGNDEAKLSGKEFAKHLTSLGFTAKRKKTERGWAGISIKRGGDG